MLWSLKDPESFPTKHLLGKPSSTFTRPMFYRRSRPFPDPSSPRASSHTNIRLESHVQTCAIEPILYDHQPIEDNPRARNLIIPNVPSSETQPQSQPRIFLFGIEWMIFPQSTGRHMVLALLHHPLQQLVPSFSNTNLNFGQKLHQSHQSSSRHG